MKKVSNNKFLRKATVAAVVCSVIGAILNVISNDIWVAVTFAAAAVSTTVFYASQIEEDND